MGNTKINIQKVTFLRYKNKDRIVKTQITYFKDKFKLFSVYLFSDLYCSVVICFIV